MEERFCETIREVRAEGRTVLLSSHILSEVEALCDTVTIIRAGRTVLSDTLASLQEQGESFDDVFLSHYRDAS